MFSCIVAAAATVIIPEGIIDGHHLIRDGRAHTVECLKQAAGAELYRMHEVFQFFFVQKRATRNSDEQALLCAESRHGKKQLVSGVDAVERATKNNILEAARGKVRAITLIPPESCQCGRAGALYAAYG